MYLSEAAETFDWCKKQVLANPDAVIVTAHHHMLRETTVASGPWEGFKKTGDTYVSHYHGYFPSGGPEGASYLHWLDDRPNAHAFEGFLNEHPNAIDFWLGGHTHTNPDDNPSGRTHIERK